ncbi:MAG: hypothetical protein IJH70_04945 [Oscillospiraceae bacterium]|nr:hypothetical protein [Oscillospiraceae bacterium]
MIITHQKYEKEKFTEDIKAAERDAGYILSDREKVNLGRKAEILYEKILTCTVDLTAV